MALPQTPALATDCVIFDPVGRVLLRPSARDHSRPQSHAVPAHLGVSLPHLQPRERNKKR
jgi:hypothetical protein